ncbi:MAG: hypothetical protein OXI81_08175 [Paracoccaceae bacterium]|nr:hypothetical protein [Paracoccaceae bacterium]MDE2911857.1 hypothetical protein [Paracoccaceae bacterium]
MTPQLSSKEKNLLYHMGPPPASAVMWTRTGPEHKANVRDAASPNVVLTGTGATIALLLDGEHGDSVRKHSFGGRRQ